MKRFADFLARINIVLMVSGFVLASVLYCTNITLRFFSFGAIAWIDHITGYLFAISPLLGSCLAIRTDENIKIDIFANFIKNHSHLKKSRISVFVSKLFCFSLSGLFLVLFAQHFSIEWARDVSGLGFIRQWMLDIPYIFFFLSSSVFFLESALLTLAPPTKMASPRETAIEESSQQ